MSIRTPQAIAADYSALVASSIENCTQLPVDQLAGLIAEHQASVAAYLAAVEAALTAAGHPIVAPV